jgi:hypothetical protein
MDPKFIAHVLGYYAELPGAKEILASTFHPPPNMDPYVVKVLSQLQMQETGVKNQTISKAI